MTADYPLHEQGCENHKEASSQTEISANHGWIEVKTQCIYKKHQIEGVRIIIFIQFQVSSI